MHAYLRSLALGLALLLPAVPAFARSQGFPMRAPNRLRMSAGWPKPSRRMGG